MDIRCFCIKLKTMVSIGLLMVFYISCVESFEPQTEIFESALIVEATITNEDKQQQVLLSRAFRLEEDGPNPESFATVNVTDDNQNEYRFEETEPGRYLSIQPFRPLQGRNYFLSITTSDGRSYSSEPASLTQESEIVDLYASRELNSDGNEGVAILLDNEVLETDTQFFRYEYEETYKIIAPRWVSVDAVVVRDRPRPPIVILEPKMEEQRVCYNTVLSNEIVLGETESSNQNGLNRQTVSKPGYFFLINL